MMTKSSQKDSSCRKDAHDGGFNELRMFKIFEISKVKDIILRAFAG